MTATARPTTRPNIERLEDRAVPTVGGLDPYFSGDGKATWALQAGNMNDEAAAVVALADGKVVTVGSVLRGSADDYDFFVTRHNRDGSLDASFGLNGRTVVAFDLGDSDHDRATCVALDGQGRILVGGYARNAAGNNDFAVCRLTAAGHLDATFSGDGKATVAFDLGGDDQDLATGIAWRGGRVVLGGFATTNSDFEFAACRLLENGTLDASFGGDGRATVAFDLGGGKNDYARAVAIDAAGRVLLAGAADAATGTDFAVCRLTPAGSLDTTFSQDGKATVAFDTSGPGTDVCRAMALDSAGRVYLAGSAASSFGGDSFAVCRLTTSGALDTTFQGIGRKAIDFDLGGSENDRANAIIVQPDGYVVLAGEVATDNGFDFGLVRLAPDGATDASLDPAEIGKATYAFDLGGTNVDACAGVAWTPDGLVLVGRADTATNGSDAAFIRVVERNRVLVSADVGGPPTVRVFTTTGTFVGKIDVYGAAFKGGVRTAAGDVTGDGIDDVFCAPGPGGAPVVKIYDGATLQFVKSIQVYGLAFTKGVNLAVGDVLGNDAPELVVSPDAGGAPFVNVFDVTSSSLVKQIQAYGLAFTKGVRVTVGDTTGSAKKEILVAPQAGGAPVVNVLDAATSAVVKQIQALDAAFTGGLYLAAGKAASGKDDLYVGPGAGGPNVVRRFDASTGNLVETYDLWPGGPLLGIRVGTTAADGDGIDDLLAATGPDTQPVALVRNDDVAGGIFTFEPFEAAMQAGLFVSGARR